MVFRRCLALTLIAAMPLVGQEIEFFDSPVVPQDETSPLVRSFIEKRERVSIMDKPCMTLSGDVRFEYDRYNERLNNEQLTGRGLVLPNDDFRVNANVYLDYTGCRDYAKIRFDISNKLGVFSTRDDRVKLRRAYLGYKLMCGGCTDWAVELGRQMLYEKFTSKVQFGSRLDGGFSKYCTTLPRLGKWYVEGGAMVLSAAFDEYAYIGESGFEDLFCTGIWVKGSYIDWTNATLLIRIEDEPEPLLVRKTLPFRTVQIEVGKKWKKVLWGRDLRVYGAYLRNVDPRDVLITPTEGDPFLVQQKNAWYAGASLGKICDCGDWVLEATYMWVQSFAFFPNDNNGIGRNANFDTNRLLIITDKGIQPVTNYKGVKTRAAFAVTDHLTAEGIFEYATDIDDTISGPSLFVRTGIRFIYSF